jgi:2-(1,2-epoxy-1,2-dihydrophenyl)acetyl-CoA isomerase
MANYETIEIERSGAVAFVTLNRPDSLNAIDSRMRREFLAAAQEVNEDGDIRVVILTGAGRGFCAGADLAEPMDGGEQTVEDILNQEYKPALMEISSAPKPWISAVNGAAAGVGSAFAMACDLTVMAEDAYIYQAFAAISLIPDGGATWHLARTLGRKRAYEIIATGEKVPADKCLEWGLCNRVVPSEHLLDEALKLAVELSSKAPLALQHAKDAINQAMEQDLPNSISNEASLQQICVESEDAAEGISAFLEKRQPQWQGR